MPIGKRKRIRKQLQKTGGKDPHYFASCYGKVRYTKEQAKERQEGVSTMKWYKCKWCPDYHVGRNS